MSKEALAKVIQRSISDAAFRRQLASDPTGALRGYELSSDESAAVRSGDSTRLTALGVEQRMSKAFALGTDSTVSNVVSSDLGASWTGALTGGDGSGATDSLTPNDGAAGSAALASGDASDTDPMIASGNEFGRTGMVAGNEPQHALNDDSDQYTPSFNYASTGDAGAQHDVIVSDEGGGAAPAPAEHSEGPEISQ